MPIALKGTGPRRTGVDNPYGDGAIIRAWSITDKNGVEHQIRSSKDLADILAEMTPQELEDWKARLRFTPVENNTGIKDYTGTLRDLA
jgi:hypothetical protein